MKRKIIQIPNFSKDVNRFLKKNLLKDNDFSEFLEELIKNPELGM